MRESRYSNFPIPVVAGKYFRHAGIERPVEQARPLSTTACAFRLAAVFVENAKELANLNKIANQDRNIIKT